MELDNSVRSSFNKTATVSNFAGIETFFFVYSNFRNQKINLIANKCFALICIVEIMMRIVLTNAFVSHHRNLVAGFKEREREGKRKMGKPWHGSETFK